LLKLRTPHILFLAKEIELLNPFCRKIKSKLFTGSLILTVTDLAIDAVDKILKICLHFIDIHLLFILTLYSKMSLRNIHAFTYCLSPHNKINIYKLGFGF